MSTPVNNHVMFAGDTKVFTVTNRKESDNSLVDFTAATISWVMVQAGTTALSKSVGSGIAVTATGIFTITLTSANTTSLSGDYQHEATATLADGTVATLFTGTIKIMDKQA